MIDRTAIDSIRGAKVVDTAGDKVGTVQQVYVHETDGHPLFVSVHTGLFGTSESFVPVEDATFDGDVLHVGFDKATVKGAPNIAADGDLNDAEQDRIYDYYDLGGVSGAGTHDGNGNGHLGTDTDLGNRSQGHDTSGPNTDDAMTRSEERLHVGTQERAAGRVRLRKHIVTEQQSVSVPVSHDEVRVEREPITQANIGKATAGADLSEEEHEVVLTEEVANVTKETVPVERVRVGTEQVTEQQTVTENVRKEQIDLDDDGSKSRR